ncbi:uncharacterized protein (TIGR02118 family) [Barrientosiimonas humi]|uniref:Uncharacterized protein (TIGR02118 family) n=2 Tax=Barrientosiimonas TaxID=1535207 RepID=A0A542XFE8_9MICO|nr:EthD family reductase [Barrientosiimonas humi]TQL34542.1 uncharacterized protein (TIGR02118 family) [Barrientosiimonas humi]CAG7574532.1 hypothetical protein BH39T_PBIAJDOK_03188 [Barrientosiimonas humi]
MIKVSVLYPRTEGARFDHEYYRSRHVPMVAELVGSAVTAWGVERGLNGGAPNAPAVYEAACWFEVETEEAWAAGFGPNADQILGDIANYTDITPVMQVSEVTATG